jgi:predicted unusual protein kinase regulating ubiquinone biosynthesis (AarF/ABC1/UbiB family)
LSLLGRGDGSEAAAQAVELLGNLRGLAAKVGQMASYVDGVVPEAQREAYERLLGKLQKATTASPFAQVQAVVEQELGQPLSASFAELDATPMASASIGQVHRARLPDGREVAVKVQHPGIELAVEQDLSNAGAMASLVSTLGPRALNVRGVHDEVAERFREELDYRLEAQRQERFAAIFANEPLVHVPRVILSHTSRRVLTSELVRAHDFAYAVACEPERRAHYASVLWRFVFRSILVEGVFNADPHPGNYLFHEDGRVTFLDFGSVQVIEPQFLQAARDMHRASIANDEAAFRVAAARACQTRAGAYETDLLSYLWRCMEPLKHSPYHMQRSYVADVVKSTQELKRHLFSKQSNVTPPPTGVALLNRLQFGFYSVLARLDAVVDYAALQRELLASVRD